MNLLKHRAAQYATVGLFSGFAMATFQGCDDGGPLGDLAEQCGLVCPDKGILEGNASISGVAQIDAFFGAVVDLGSAAASVNAGVRAELDAMALSLGLEAGAPVADIKGALQAKISANVEGSLKVEYKPAECSASVEVAAKAAAECDVDVDPGEVSVKCEGSCQVDASAMAECSGDATLKCTGTAPNFACSGSCSGNCELTAEAECTGTCRGTCNGTCTVMDSSGNCAGECMGMCQGTCELKAGGSCSGECQGSCEYEPGMAGCEANAEVKCEASANASVECEGKCEGKAEPPMVKAECEASVEAKASAQIECTPPELQIAFQWKAGVDATAQAEFKAWLEGFRGQFSAMIAASAKAEIVIDAAANMITAADGAFSAGLDAAAKGDLKAKIGAGCAVKELDGAIMILGDARADVEGSFTAVAEISSVVKG